MRAEPWMDRTVTQADANEVDCDLYRLIGRVERRAAAATPKERKIWEAAAEYLRTARVPIRSLMHRQDVAQTW